MTKAAQYVTQVLSGESTLQALVRISALTEAQIMDAAQKGAVWVSLQRGGGNTRPRRLHALATDVVEGSTLMLNHDPLVLAQQPRAMFCVSDQVNYGVWFKPSGMLCQGSKWSDHTVATQVASGISARHCYLVHRLDKATCGLLIIAYTKNALRKLSALFEQRSIDKYYQAYVKGEFSAPMPLQLDTPIDQRAALTIVQSVQYNKQFDRSALRLRIETGRKHQIRRHLAALGYPVIGDRLYSGPGAVNDAVEDLQLVAHALRFECPFSGEDIAVSIDADNALAGTLTDEVQG